MEMSFESIIGVVSGLICIASFVWGRAVWLRKKLQIEPPVVLFGKLIDRKISDAKHRDILKILNKSKLFNHQIKDEYIQSFTLNNRGKEAVLFDICDNNDIEPSDDLCKELVGSCMPSLQKRYKQNREKTDEKPTDVITPVVEHSNTVSEHISNGEQKVFLSELLQTKYPDVCNRLTQILDKCSVKYAFLKATKDIWCRDYMPVQTHSGKLVQFKYDPSYLRGNKEWEESRSDVEEVCKANNINAEFSKINIDGGNVLICEDRAILTDRIYSENPGIDKDELKKKLAELLECEIIIIPSYRSKEDDLTGHADGMVRFVDRNTILGNCLTNEYQYIKDGMQKAIEEFKLKYIEMPFFIDNKDPQHPYSAIGVYVNYLEVNNLIVMPIFGRKEEDDKAYSVLKATFPDRIIETIDYNEVAKEGGLLNCTTWVIKQ